MTGQLDMFDPHGPLRQQLPVRARGHVDTFLDGVARWGIRGRLVGAAKWSNATWVRATGVTRRCARSFERAGIVEVTGEDVVVKGWQESARGKDEDFRRRQSELARRSATARWTPRRDDPNGILLGSFRPHNGAESQETGDAVAMRSHQPARAPARDPGSEISSLAPDPHEVGPTSQRPRSPSRAIPPAPAPAAPPGVTIHPPLSSHRSVPPQAATPVHDRASTQPEPEPEDREARTGRSTPRASRREPGEVRAREAAPSPARPGRVRFGDMSPGARRVWASYPRRKIRKRHMWPFWEAWQRLGLEEYGAEVLELLEDCSRMAAWRDHPSHVPWSWNFLEQQAAALLPRWARAKANRPGAVVLATERPPPTPEAKAKAADAITAAIELREAPPVGTWYTTSRRQERAEEPDEDEPRAPLAWAFALWPAGR